MNTVEGNPVLEFIEIKSPSIVFPYFLQFILEICFRFEDG